MRKLATTEEVMRQIEVIKNSNEMEEQQVTCCHLQ